VVGEKGHEEWAAGAAWRVTGETVAIYRTRMLPLPRVLVMERVGNRRWIGQQRRGPVSLPPPWLCAWKTLVNPFSGSFSDTAGFPPATRRSRLGPSSDLPACTSNSCATPFKTCFHFYLLAHVPLQTFLDFTVILMLFTS
jgi:hypothetical protein